MEIQCFLIYFLTDAIIALNPLLLRKLFFPLTSTINSVFFYAPAMQVIIISEFFTWLQIIIIMLE
jgi:hypothetical protein